MRAVLRAIPTLLPRRSFSRKSLRNDVEPDTVLYVGKGDLAGCATVHSYKARVGDAFRLTHPSSNLYYYGVTVNVWADTAWVRILDNQVATKGDVAVLLKDDQNSKTRQPWALPVGSELLGHVLDPNFRPVSLFDTNQVNATRFATISTWQPAIADRKRITQSIHTGIAFVDCLVPLGKGQCMLVYGEQGTGKTTMVLDILASQPQAKCVYVAMGKSAAEMALIVEALKARGTFERTLVLWADPQTTSKVDLFALPHMAVTVAQSFRDAGEHAFIVYDDFNAHIPTYTQLCSALDAQMVKTVERHVLWRLYYSGIAQRSACLSDFLGGGTLTSLMLLETPEFVPYEMMSVSDGQVCLSRDVLLSGCSAEEQVILEAKKALEVSKGSSDSTLTKKSESPTPSSSSSAVVSQQQQQELFWPCVDVRKSLSRIGAGTLLPPELLPLCKTLRGDILQWLDEPIKGHRRAMRILHTLRQPKSTFVTCQELVLRLYIANNDRVVAVLDNSNIMPEDMPAFLSEVTRAAKQRLGVTQLNMQDPRQEVMLRLIVAECAHSFVQRKQQQQQQQLPDSKKSP